MKIFNKVFGIVLNFFFPKDETELLIENITIHTLSRKLSMNNKRSNKDVYALFDYRDKVIKNMIWSLKYKKNHQIAEMFAQILYDFLGEEFSDLNIYSDFNKPFLIPIPMHKKHLKERTYNQTVFLGKKLSAIGGKSFCVLDTEVLKKIKNTTSQTKLHRNKRLINVKGAFRVFDHEKIEGRNIVLLDDVTTTGATLSEAKRVLLESGAKRVICVALAH